MKRLWAPWRKAYIRPDKSKKAQAGCLFCRIFRETRDTKNLILHRESGVFSVLNLYPYNNGHVLIVPNRHVQDLSDLTEDEALALFRLTNHCIRALKSSMRVKGFNVGLNLGADAGAGIPSHLHMHIVPRWPGDHNFMPVLAGTKVISESLASSYKLLRSALQKKKHVL